MTKEISSRTAEFLDRTMPAIVGTRRRDGTVKMSPAWYEYRDGLFWLNSRRGAHWLAQVERDGQATLLFVDPEDMHRVVHVEARLVRTATDEAVDHVHRLSQRYRGEPYRFVMPQQRVLIVLEPVRVRSTVDALAARARAR